LERSDANYPHYWQCSPAAVDAAGNGGTMSEFNAKPEADLSPTTRMLFLFALGKYLFGSFEPGPREPTEHQKWKQKQEQEQ
jgi:hypothetical protein